MPPQRAHKGFFSFITWTILFSFVFTSIVPVNRLWAQTIPSSLPLPQIGARISTSPVFTPVILKGVTIDPQNPLRFNFIIDTGHAELDEAGFNQEALKIVKYFLASLTVPEDEMWVNLSPYEKDRIIPENFD